MVVSGRKAQNIAHFNNKIIAQLLLTKPYSCIEMAKKTSLTHTATGLIVDRLLNMELIRVHVESAQKRSKGRQHVRYEINPDRAFFVCINFQNGKESLTVYDLVGNVLHSERIGDKKVDEEYLERIIMRIKQRISELGLSEDKLAIISIAIPGRIDSISGSMIVSSKIKNDVNLKEMFARYFEGVNVAINNDIIYACTGSLLSNEFDYSKGSHIYVYVGSGLSCCLINKGEIVTGSNGFGGEIGMNLVNMDGVHLHDIVSIENLVRNGREILKDENATLEQIIKSSEREEPIRAILEKMALALGISLKNIVDITGCSHMVFSGEVTKFPTYFFDMLNNVVRNTNYSDKVDYVTQLSRFESANLGQMYLSRLSALDVIMAQY